MLEDINLLENLQLLLGGVSPSLTFRWENLPFARSGLRESTVLAFSVDRVGGHYRPFLRPDSSLF